MANHRGSIGLISKAEGDHIAQAVLDLVRELAESQCTPRKPPMYDHNVRPEPIEARLGYMP